MFYVLCSLPSAAKREPSPSAGKGKRSNNTHSYQKVSSNKIAAHTSCRSPASVSLRYASPAPDRGPVRLEQHFPGGGAVRTARDENNEAPAI